MSEGSSCSKRSRRRDDKNDVRVLDLGFVALTRRKQASKVLEGCG
jgi:hypothetical protein